MEKCSSKILLNISFCVLWWKKKTGLEYHVNRWTFPLKNKGTDGKMSASKSLNCKGIATLKKWDLKKKRDNQGVDTCICLSTDNLNHIWWKLVCFVALSMGYKIGSDEVKNTFSANGQRKRNLTYIKWWLSVSEGQIIIYMNGVFYMGFLIFQPCYQRLGQKQYKTNIAYIYKAINIK